MTALTIDVSTAVAGAVRLEPSFKTFPRVALHAFHGGAFSYVAPAATLHKVTMGRYCSIGDGVSILSSHPSQSLTTSPFPYQMLFASPFDAPPQVQYTNVEHTTIGNDVWIGSGVKIKSGITIGDGAIIGAGSVVTKDVEPFTIVGGVPAKVIRPRFDERTTKLVQESRWWRYALVGLDLPWASVLETVKAVNVLAQSGQLQPYESGWFDVWREQGKIPARRAEGTLPSP